MNTRIIEKKEQCIILKFLIKLGKSRDKCCNLLKKVYQKGCMTRNSIHAYFDEVNRISIRSSNKIKKIEMKKDEVCFRKKILGKKMNSLIGSGFSFYVWFSQFISCIPFSHMTHFNSYFAIFSIYLL